jgi:hypothetical protein
VKCPSLRDALLLSLAVQAACASAPREKTAATAVQVNQTPDNGQDAGSADTPQISAAAPDKTLRPELAGGAAGYLGVLERKGLNAIIDQGLGRVLARLKLSPALRGGRFEGFRVSEIDPAWLGTGLLVGDVLLRLNGQVIERPEQAQAAFESLRVASEVALELNRAGEKLSLRYRIE